MQTAAMDWTLEGLASAGFEGFVTFADLPRESVPGAAGVYCRVPGLMEALIPRKDESHGST
jgi:hypothetical protein